MSTEQISAQPHIRAVHMPLFDTASSLQDAANWAESHLPITSKNTLMSVLMVYHNTLLKTLKEQSTELN